MRVLIVTLLVLLFTATTLQPSSASSEPLPEECRDLGAGLGIDRGVDTVCTTIESIHINLHHETRVCKGSMGAPYASWSSGPTTDPVPSWATGYFIIFYKNDQVVGHDITIDGPLDTIKHQDHLDTGVIWHPKGSWQWAKAVNVPSPAISFDIKCAWPNPAGDGVPTDARVEIRSKIDVQTADGQVIQIPFEGKGTFCVRSVVITC